MLRWRVTERTLPILWVASFLFINILQNSMALTGTACNNNTECTIHETCNNTSTTPGVCICAVEYYDGNGTMGEGGECLPKVGLGSQCPRPDACFDPNAECGAGNTCTCKSGFYDSDGNTLGGTCTSKVGLGSQCPRPDACFDPNAECGAGNTCTCKSGFYDSDGNTLGGTCTSKVGLGSTCHQPDACSTSNAECGISPANVNQTCVCHVGYYDSNGALGDGNCSNVTNLQVSGINYVMITEKSITISWNAPSDQAAVNYYLVGHKPDNSSDSEFSQNVSKNTTAVLGNLVAGQRYSINITSVNTNTSSTQRSTFVMDYQISKPSTPGNLTNNMNIDASSGKISLNWSSSEGVVTGYIGFLQNTTLLFQYNVTFNTRGTIPVQEFFGVKSGTWYTFTVQSFSGYSDTKTLYSNVHTEPIKTKVQVPDPPTNISCLSPEEKSMHLTWNKPLNPNGDILHYLITVNQTDPSAGIFNIITPDSDTKFIVTNLSAGSFYKFQVFTVNEGFQSTSYGESNTLCGTKANMSEMPSDLNISSKTGRSGVVTWNKPNQTHGVLYGYSLQIFNITVCIGEVLWKCNNCVAGFPMLDAAQCSNHTEYNVTSDYLQQPQRYEAVNLLPYTNYTVVVSAITGAGRGYFASGFLKTEEEVPQKPYHINFTDIQATTATVVWSIDEPQPGNTTYTIIATGKRPAATKTCKVTGFFIKSCNLMDLEEYWDYNLTVNASTQIGSNQSDSISFMTKAAPAGQVSNFTVREESGNDNYANVRVSWRLPILERNGPVNSFSIQVEVMINDIFTKINDSNVTSYTDESDIYIDFPVQREKLYRFTVFAFNGQPGASSRMNYSLPAVPVNPTSFPAGAVAGGISGGVAAIILIAVIVVILQRRSKNLKKARRGSNDSTESMDDLTKKIKKNRPVNLMNFAEYVADYHKDSNLKFSEEYEDLKNLSPQHSHEAADMEENRLKNRFVNILPFDHSRVRLLPIDDVHGSDYINANYLPGFSKTREYIACQGPIPATIDDHWRLIWEQNVRVIVMLTQYKEENRVKCEPYMPLEPKDPKQYGDIVVECLTYSSMNSFEYRTLKIRLGEKERTIKHFHFLSWRDYSANVQFDTMIDFIKKVRSFIQPPDVEGPLIVHCSAGVGRTGTYITIDHMIQHIDKYGTDSTIDIFNFVLKMRENRTTMVQTEQQYIFIHDCIKDYLDRFKTYENQAFNHEEENFYQNTEALELYQNVNFNSTQKTEL